VRVSPGATDVELVVCHLKSKLLRFPSPPGHPSGGFSTRDEGVRALRRLRAGAARRRSDHVRAHVTERLDGHGQQRALIVMGDLNDEPLAATTQILLGPPGSEIDTPGFDRPDQGDGQRLWNLAARIPAERRFTRRFEDRGELIDHLLVSHALTHHIDSVDTTSDTPSITTDPAARGRTRIRPRNDLRARLDQLTTDHRPPEQRSPGRKPPATARRSSARRHGSALCRSTALRERVSVFLCSGSCRVGGSPGRMKMVEDLAVDR
jgi:hypothetical protein